MPRNSFLLILPILSGTACVYNYGEGTVPQDTGSSSTGPAPDEPDTDPPTTAPTHRFPGCVVISNRHESAAPEQMRFRRFRPVHRSEFQ